MVDRMHPLAKSTSGSPDCPVAQLVALPPIGRLIIRSDGTALASIGFEVPDICRATLSGGRSLLRLGPDEFLLLTSDNRAPALASAVDVSHRDTALTVSGQRATWVINTFCALDLHQAAFPVGMCTRTLLGKAEIVLWRTGAEIFRIEVARSFAPYVWACLEEARREFLG